MGVGKPALCYHYASPTPADARGRPAMTTRFRRRPQDLPLHMTPPGPNAGPDNDEPLPDAMYQGPNFTRTMEIVYTIFMDQESTLVSGDSPRLLPGSPGGAAVREARLLRDLRRGPAGHPGTQWLLHRRGGAPRPTLPWKSRRKAPPTTIRASSETCTPGWALGNTGGSTPAEATITVSRWQEKNWWTEPTAPLNCTKPPMA